MDVAVIAKIHDIKELLARGRIEPEAVFAELKRLAASNQWQTREVAATALVEIGKRHPAAVLNTARSCRFCTSPTMIFPGLRARRVSDPGY